jgi:hypothetical protein
MAECDDRKPAIELASEKYMIPMTTYVTSNFLTSRAAARHMLTRHSGVASRSTFNVLRCSCRRISNVSTRSEKIVKKKDNGCYCTMIVPTKNGCSVQKYLYSPGSVGIGIGLLC